MTDKEYRIEESNGMRQIVHGRRAMSIDEIVDELNASHDIRQTLTRAFDGLREIMQDYGR